ncbi:hypothetical protein AVEN_41272-1 [Araneus ventricosus]|uniref:Uncharacterized protein n=1 Tax=Araneus ventricosus TaxID=182803 RepID=A0A4Y2CC99_ARAVE|nr:hypothetical protein AVEN_41272-1 [Araneus ventricosus]
MAEVEDAWAISQAKSEESLILLRIVCVSDSLNFLFKRRRLPKHCRERNLSDKSHSAENSLEEHPIPRVPCFFTATANPPSISARIPETSLFWSELRSASYFMQISLENKS